MKAINLTGMSKLDISVLAFEINSAYKYMYFMVNKKQIHLQLKVPFVLNYPSKIFTLWCI